MKQRYYGITQKQNIIVLGTIEVGANMTEIYAAAVRHNKNNPADLTTSGILTDVDLYRIIEESRNALNTLPY